MSGSGDGEEDPPTFSINAQGGSNYQAKNQHFHNYGMLGGLVREASRAFAKFGRRVKASPGLAATCAAIATAVVIVAVQGLYVYGGLGGRGGASGGSTESGHDPGAAATLPSQAASGEAHSPLPPAASSTPSPSKSPSAPAVTDPGWVAVYRDRAFSMPGPGTGSSCIRNFYDLDKDPVDPRINVPGDPDLSGVDVRAMDIEWHTSDCSKTLGNRDAITFNVLAVGNGSETAAASPEQCSKDARQLAITNPVSSESLYKATVIRKGAAFCLETKDHSILYLKVSGLVDGEYGPASVSFSASLWKKG